MRYKKWFPLVLICFIVGGVIFLFFKESGVSAPKKTGASPAPNFTPPQAVKKNPYISFYPNEPQGVVFTLNITPVLPQQLPTYFFPPPTEYEINTLTSALTSSLGFPQEPLSVGLPGKTTSVWNNNGKTLSFSEKTFNISYSENVDVSPFISISPTQADEAARKFLSSVTVYNNFSLSLASANLVEIDEGSFAGRKIFDLYYQVLLGGYPVIFSSKPEAVSTTIDGSGKILSTSLPLPPREVVEKETVSLLPQSSILQNLNRGNGTLLQATDHNKEGALPPDVDFSSVLITSLQVGYYKNPEDNIARPIYLLKGTAQSGGGLLNVQYMLPATN